MQYINTAYLLIGGNVGDMRDHLKQAINWLNLECGEVVKTSSIYQTAPWGNTDQEPFLNQALVLETSYSAHSLMPMLLQIEESMGRKRLVKYGPRIIDIDILLFNEQIVEEPALIIPHPELQNRLFALVPLAEIAAPVMHPVLKKTIGELLKESNDKLEVCKIAN